MRLFNSEPSIIVSVAHTRRRAIDGAGILPRLLMIAAVLFGADSANALTLVGVSSLTNVQSTNSSGTLTSDLDTGEWFASSSAGLNDAVVYADLGIGRSYTSTLPADSGTRTSTTSVEWYITIKNDSFSTVSLAAGAFRAEWDFSLSKVESTAPSSRLTATSVGTLSVVSAGPSVSYRQIDQTGEPTPFVLGSGVRNGLGTFEILAADESTFSATAKSGPVDLLPGAEGRVTVTFINSVTAGPGWEATIDGTRSVRLFAELPDGLTLDSPRPLGFVSAVPETPTSALAFAGILVISAIARIRSRNAAALARKCLH
jgi:hypothetical protein